MLASSLAVVHIPIVHGKPINIWGGILLGVLITFQLLTGLGWIKVPTNVHRWNGITVFALAAAHGVIGFMVWFEGWQYG